MKPAAKYFADMPARLGHRNLAASFPSYDLRIESY